MDNGRSQPLKTLEVKGSITASLNHSVGNFKADNIQLHEFPEAVYIDAKSDQGLRMISFQLAKDIRPDVYDLAQENGPVQVYYYNGVGSTPWTYLPDSGKLHLTEINLKLGRVTATFSFTSLRVPKGEEPLKVTQGKLNLTGA